jgi:hypothetical protein
MPGDVLVLIVTLELPGRRALQVRIGEVLSSCGGRVIM